VDITQLASDMLRGMTGIVKSSSASGCRRCAKARFSGLARRGVNPGERALG